MNAFELYHTFGIVPCLNLVFSLSPDYKHGTAGRHWNYSTEPFLVAATKYTTSASAPPNTDWLFEKPYMDPSDPLDYDNSHFCPPMQGTKKVSMSLGSEVVNNLCQRPMLLYRHLVLRFSTSQGLVAEFTGGSGTLAATCANFADLRERSGANNFSSVGSDYRCSQLLFLILLTKILSCARSHFGGEGAEHGAADDLAHDQPEGAAQAGE